jgi:hypothetical protein
MELGPRTVAGVHQAFLFEKIAVMVGPWWEPAEPPERGARVEVRMRPEEPRRGSLSAAQRVVIDQPVFRADLFDRLDHPPGNLLSAHFHEGFDGVEPRDRLWPPELRRDPIAWLQAELGDLPRVLARAGVAAEAEAVARDAEALRAALPAITDAVETAWAAARATAQPA